MLELVTGANVIRGHGSCRLANHMQILEEEICLGIAQVAWSTQAQTMTYQLGEIEGQVVVISPKLA
jgi:hypothetical protein